MKSLDELRAFAADPLLGLAPQKLHGETQKLHAEMTNAIADHIEAELAERYVALPLDADDVPIRVGDEMECINNGEHCPVEYIALTEDGWEVDGESPASMRHYHTPTVESILREFVEEWDCLFDYERDVLIAEYAAKLQLREG